MRRRDGTNQIIFLALTDLLLTGIALYLGSQARFYLPFGLPVNREMIEVPALLYAVAVGIWALVFALMAVYDVRRTYRALDEVQRVTLAVAIASLAFAGLLFVLYRELPRRIFVYFTLLDLAFLLGYRLLLRYGFRATGRRTSGRVLILGAGKVGREVAQRVRHQEWAGFTVVGFLDDDPAKQHQSYEGAPVLGALHDAAAVIQQHGVDEVVVALPLRAHTLMEEMVLSLQELPVNVRIVPDFFDLVFFRATIEDLGGVPLIGLRDSAIDGYQRITKRLLDLAVAVPMVVVLSPLLAIIALAIRLDSKGPAIFRGQRVGENGKLFRVYKFRTMVVDAEKRQAEVVVQAEDGTVLHKRPDDPRITRLGRMLRRTSLDELPQLINVIKGEMSLVGPRPELPYLVQKYERWQRKRLAVPPGMTGWWQINGRSDRPMHLHTEDDLYYIQNYSILLDLRILWRTIGVVLRGKGAY